MKKVFFGFLCSLLFISYGFSQNNLTQDQIRKYANELGVPYEALQRLINSYQVKTGLSNPNANGAQLISLPELDFMREAGKLEIGSYYRIRERFFNQSGTSVNFNNGSVLSDFFVNFPGDTEVDALICFKIIDGWKRLVLVEIAVVK